MVCVSGDSMIRELRTIVADSPEWLRVRAIVFATGSKHSLLKRSDAFLRHKMEVTCILILSSSLHLGQRPA